MQVNLRSIARRNAYVVAFQAWSRGLYGAWLASKESSEMVASNETETSPESWLQMAICQLLRPV